MSGMPGPRMLDAVGASDEQKAQIRQIMLAARKDLHSMRESGRALREQARTLFAQPTVDANAVEALRQQMMAQADQASKRMTQALIDASRVLTPEQRQQIADRMAKRRALFERQRAEREALEGAPAPR
jgi:protein CpxP